MTKMGKGETRERGEAFGWLVGSNVEEREPRTWPTRYRHAKCLDDRVQTVPIVKVNNSGRSIVIGTATLILELEKKPKTRLYG
jgi:hypothetical protein